MMSRPKWRERADHRQPEAAQQVFSYLWQVLKMVPGLLSCRHRQPASEIEIGAFIAFEFDVRCRDPLMRVHLGIESTIEASIADF
jgi:hypothetical protein